VENKDEVERLLTAYTRVKPPLKFYLSTQVKQTLGLPKLTISEPKIDF